MAVLALLGAERADAANRLGMRIEEGGAKVAATFTPKKTPVEYSIRLNGGHIEDVFAGSAPAGRRVILSLQEGLRFGSNTLRVRALFHDGKVVKVVRRFNLGSRRPLVGIAGDRRVHEGVPMRLRAREKRGVRFTWEVLKRPDGSEAELKRPHASRPQFSPDAPGIYRVALTAHNADGATRTAVTPLLVESQAATKAGVFVGLEPLDSTTQGNPTALRIFGGSSEGSYPIGSQNGQGGPIVNLIFDRCTLTQIGEPLYIGTGEPDVARLNAAIIEAQQGLVNSGCSILVLTTGADYGTIGVLGPALDIWTGQATENFAYEGLTNPFWAIYSPAPFGSPANAKGKGWSDYPYFDGGTPAGRMAGELVPDQNGNYVFRQSTAVGYGEQNTQLRFHMAETGITLPEQGGAPATFPAGSPGCPQNGQGGFQLVVVGAAGQGVLDLTGIATAPVNGQTVGNGDTFWVNGCTPQEGETWAQALQQVLGSVGTNYNDDPQMIFLQGVGSALPPASTMTPGETQALRDVAAMLGNMGGSAGVFLNNEAATSGPGYSFAGQSWPLPGGSRVSTEVSSSTHGGPPAQLDGYIKPDQISRLAPSTGTSAGEVLGPDLENYRAPESASAIVNLADFTPTSFPGAGDQGWASAMYYLSKSVFDPVLKYDGTDACYAPKMDSNWIVYDVRSMYCGGGSGSNTCDYPWSAYYSQIAPGEPGAKFVAGNGFDEPTWNQVLPQLQKEFSMIEDLNCTIGAYQVAYGSQSEKADLDVSEMVDDVNAYIKKQISKAQIGALVGDSFEVLASLANVLAVVASVKEAWTAMNVFWGIQGVIDLGESIATLTVDVKSVLGPLPPNTTATAYASMLENGLQTSSAALSTPRDQIASDWGRLQAFDQAGLDLQKNDVRDAETALSYATYDRIWRQLLPSGFVPAHLNVNTFAGDSPPIDVPNYECVNDPSNNLPGESQPFETFTPNTYTLYPEGATSANPTGLEAYVLAGTYYSDDFYQPIQAPDKQVLAQLFAPLPDPDAVNPSPITNNQATPLGINKEQFFADVIESAQAANPSQIFEVSPNNGYCPYP